MKKRILFLVTEDWAFISHRLTLALRLLRDGWDVGVACSVTEDDEKIRSYGITVLPVPFARESLSLISAARAAIALAKVIHYFQPSIVQAVALRTIIIGGLALRRQKAPQMIALVTGLGSLFSGRLHTWRLRFTRVLVEMGMKWILGRNATCTVFQNSDDRQLFKELGWVSDERECLIQGSGIPIPEWFPESEPVTPPTIFLFVGRLLRDKGVGELVAAARLLRARRLPIIIRLLGEPDLANPEAFTHEEVRSWETDALVECLGRRMDVHAQMMKAHVVVLPSYREGLSRVILEAGVCGRAVITCDVPGCREVVTHKHNGLLVPPKDEKALAEAIDLLHSDANLRQELAMAHRARVIQDFSDSVIHEKFIDLYEKLLAPSE